MRSAGTLLTIVAACGGHSPHIEPLQGNVSVLDAGLVASARYAAIAYHAAPLADDVSIALERGEYHCKRAIAASVASEHPPVDPDCPADVVRALRDASVIGSLIVVDSNGARTLGGPASLGAIDSPAPALLAVMLAGGYNIGDPLAGVATAVPGGFEVGAEVEDPPQNDVCGRTQPEVRTYRVVVFVDRAGTISVRHKHLVATRQEPITQPCHPR